MPDEQPRKGNVLTQKFGPLPLWAWLAIITAIALGYWLFFVRGKNQAAPAVPQVAVVSDQPPAAEPAAKAGTKDKDAEADEDAEDKKPTHHRTHQHTHRREPAGRITGSGGTGGSVPLQAQRRAVRRKPHQTTAGGDNPPIYKPVPA